MRSMRLSGFGLHHTACDHFLLLEDKLTTGMLRSGMCNRLAPVLSSLNHVALNSGACALIRVIRRSNDSVWATPHGSTCLPCQKAIHSVILTTYLVHSQRSWLMPWIAVISSGITQPCGLTIIQSCSSSLPSSSYSSSANLYDVRLTVPLTAL